MPGQAHWAKFCQNTAIILSIPLECCFPNAATLSKHKRQLDWIVALAYNSSKNHFKTYGRTFRAIVALPEKRSAKPEFAIEVKRTWYLF
jgi:hypothetical protein